MRKIPFAWEFSGNCIRCTSHVPMDNGYVYVRGGGKFWSVPRRIAFKKHGELPYAVVTRHSCDNQWCINPTHIEIGTRGENSQDMAIRGRALSGERHNMCKLTESDVRDIRSSSEPSRELANRYGIRMAHVWSIRTRKAWKHL